MIGTPLQVSHRQMGAAGSAIQPVPGFVLCDGHFEPSYPHSGGLTDWCGWIRFEGHGECKIQCSEESSHEIVGQWKASDENTVRIVIRRNSAAPSIEALLVREGPDLNTIYLSEEGALASPVVFVFCPEESHN